MELEKDFQECFVVDPSKSDQTKKDIFAEIMEKYGLKPEEVLVVGDDIDSEIRAGKELGIDTVLYDYAGTFSESSTYKGNVITNYDRLKHFV